MNFIILSVIASFIVAEIINYLLKSKEDGAFNLDNLFEDGGMPSRHSALVSALAYSVGIVEGFSSTIFLVSLIFALIVLRDAIGVRHNVDRVLGLLNKQVKKKDQIHVVSGHTKKQVMAGVILAIIVVSLLQYF